MAENFEDDFEGVVVSFINDEGDELLYRQEMIIPVDGQDYALLIGQNIENDTEFFDDEDNVIIAKIVKDENGEDEYIDPTDEEFEAVQKAYNEYMDALEAEE